jgi:hypothetical protein
MLMLGSAGLTRELFLVVGKPDLVRVWVSIGLVLGPAVLESLIRAYTGTRPGAPSETPSSPRVLP